MSRQFIPEQVEELTPEWLTDALRERGLLSGSTVRKVRHELLGVGDGFMGVLARLFLEFDGDGPDLPATLIAKLPTAVPENRGMGELLGAYEREIYFYEEFASRLPLRVPRVYYSALDRDPVSKHQEGIVGFVDRLPATLIRGSMAFARWVAARKQRRYLLLLEDLDGARPGDQVAAGNPEDCERVLKAIARAHAAFWEHPSLVDPFWLFRPELQTRTRQLLYRDSLPPFEQRFGSLMREGLARVTGWLAEHGGALTRTLHSGAPHTLIHGDLRFDNLFFDDMRPDDPVIVIDWQLAGCGAGAYDVAYLIGGSLPSGASAETEAGLLHAYHESLIARGVKNYAYERFADDYSRGLLSVIQTIASVDLMEFGEERGVDLIDVWVERLLARTRNLDLDRLL